MVAKKRPPTAVTIGGLLRLRRTIGLIIPRRVASPQSSTPFHQALPRLVATNPLGKLPRDTGVMPAKIHHIEVDLDHVLAGDHRGELAHDGENQPRDQVQDQEREEKPIERPLREKSRGVPGPEGGTGHAPGWRQPTEGEIGIFPPARLQRRRRRTR
jgi:hypothetical protein